MNILFICHVTDSFTCTLPTNPSLLGLLLTYQTFEHLSSSHCVRLILSFQTHAIICPVTLSVINRVINMKYTSFDITFMYCIASLCCALHNFCVCADSPVRLSTKHLFGKCCNPTYYLILSMLVGGMSCQ